MEAPRPQVLRAKGHLTRIKLQKTPRDDAEHGEGEAEEQGTGGQITRRHHPGTAGYWAVSRVRKGGGGVRVIEAGRGRKETLDRRTLVLTSTGEQAEDILWAALHGREAQTSGSSRQAGAPSRWMVAPRPGEIGEGETGAKRERSGINGWNMKGNGG